MLPKLSIPSWNNTALGLLFLIEDEPAKVEQQILGNTCRWVFDRKLNEVTNTVMEKARLVVQGFMQILGVDYDEVYTRLWRC